MQFEENFNQFGRFLPQIIHFDEVARDTFHIYAVRFKDVLQVL